MPDYDYKCSNCLHNFEIYQGILEDALERCPECHVDRLYRVPHAPMCFTRGEPTTLGHLADRNSEKFGKAECQERELRAKERVAKSTGKKSKEPSQTPWWRNGSIPGLIKKDNMLTPTECQQYTEELKAVGVNIENQPKIPERVKAKRRK